MKNLIIKLISIIGWAVGIIIVAAFMLIALNYAYGFIINLLKTYFQ